MKRIIGILLTVLLLTSGCNQSGDSYNKEDKNTMMVKEAITTELSEKETTIPTEEKEPISEQLVRHSGKLSGVWYEVFVRAFADSDNDGIGDLKGLVDKLDYLNDGDEVTDTDLNVDGIWLMPINPSASYHGYDVTDYYDINSEYGTMEDFELLIKEAHKRDVKVIMDLVINHSSSKHPWFQQALTDDESPYREYYQIVSKDEVGYDFNANMWGHKVWNKVGDYYYYAIFWDQMPDFDFKSEPLRKEVINIASFWIDKGIDGFRIDAVSHIYGQGELKDGQGYSELTREWWQYFADEVRQLKPDIYLVGEAWEPLNSRVNYAETFDTTFNFDLGERQLLSIVKNKIDLEGKNNGLVDYIEHNYESINEVNEAFVDGIFLSNHDMRRSMDYLNGDSESMKLAANIYFTLPGNPFIYYGEEIGMKGNKPDEYIREPFIWGRQDRYQTSWIDLKYNSETINVSKQLLDESSMLNHYINLIALRKNNDILLKGDFRAIETTSSRLIAYKRAYNGKEMTIVHNISQNTETIDAQLISGEHILYSSKEMPLLNEGNYEISPRSTVVFEE